MNPSLVRYAKTLQSRGVSRADAKTLLDRYGYSSDDVSDALREAYGRSMVLPVVLFLIAVGALGVWWFVQDGGSSLQSSLSIVVVPPAVTTGVPFSIESSVSVSESVQAVISASVIDSKGKSIFSDSDSRKLSGSSKKTFAVPPIKSSGSYTVTVTLVAGGQTVKKQGVLRVAQKVPDTGGDSGGSSQPVVPVPPDEVNDGSCGACAAPTAWTSASCTDGSCIITDIVPYCGNFKCEDTYGETSVSCSSDCRASTGKSDSEVRSDAVTYASTQPDRAKALCSTLSIVKKNSCLSEAAEVSGDDSFCDIVSNENGAQSECYLTLVLDERYRRIDICSKIRDFESRDQCVALASVMQVQQVMNTTTQK